MSERKYNGVETKCVVSAPFSSWQIVPNARIIVKTDYKTGVKALYINLKE